MFVFRSAYTHTHTCLQTQLQRDTNLSSLWLTLKTRQNVNRVSVSYSSIAIAGNLANHSWLVYFFIACVFFCSYSSSSSLRYINLYVYILEHQIKWFCYCVCCMQQGELLKMESLFDLLYYYICLPLYKRFARVEWKTTWTKKMSSSSNKNNKWRYIRCVFVCCIWRSVMVARAIDFFSLNVKWRYTPDGLRFFHRCSCRVAAAVVVIVQSRCFRKKNVRMA